MCEFAKNSCFTGRNWKPRQQEKHQKFVFGLAGTRRIYLANVVHACIKFYIVLPETQVSSRVILVSIILSIFFHTARSIILLCK